ncbi:MAG: hypothetical protein H6747_03965 [Deltaproteobacteria bacterium]|nr:hypothetical protein [Deltaproteobacteria bacterium]
MLFALATLTGARPCDADTPTTMAVESAPEAPKAPTPGPPKSAFRRMSVDPPRSFPWVRAVLAAACGLTAVGADDPWARVGWLTLGGGLGAWAAWDATTRERPSLAGATGRTFSWAWSF